MASIGTNIKKLRQNMKLTQEQLAEKLGVTFQAVSKWETSSNTLILPFFQALQKSLDA